MSARELAVNRPLDLRLDLWLQRNANRHFTDIMLQKEFDQLIDGIDSEFQSSKCNNPAGCLNEHSVHRVIKP